MSIDDQDSGNQSFAGSQAFRELGRILVRRDASELTLEMEKMRSLTAWRLL